VVNDARAARLCVAAPPLSEEDSFAFQSTLTGEFGDPAEAEIVATERVDERLLAEIQEITYTLILAGGTAEYLAGVIQRIRSRFDDCAVFDFRNHTLTVTKHPDVSQMRGKTLIVAEEGSITVETANDRGIFRDALRQLLSGGAGDDDADH
jgi:hypothetical protein